MRMANGTGVTREGAMRDGAIEEIARGAHLTAVYPALFNVALLISHDYNRNFYY